MTHSEQELQQSTPFFGANSTYIAEIYEQYLRNPESVDASWKVQFAAMGDQGAQLAQDFGGPAWDRNPTKIVGHMDATRRAELAAKTNDNADNNASSLAVRAHMLIRAYRVRGHLLASLDPLGLKQRQSHPELDPAHYGFGDDDMDTPIFLDGWLGHESLTLREILAILTQTYSQNFAIEFIHIQSLEKKQWLEHEIESTLGRPSLSIDEKKQILQTLTEVVGFEEFLHKKYPGAKRFSAEGGDNLFTAMDAAVNVAASMGVKDVVVGMPHRGRLNVLTNFMRKPYAAMLSEFEGNLAIPEDIDASGDVKYHLGASADRMFDGKEVHLSLTPNPSHLEAVNPVVCGRVRAKQDQANDLNREQVMGILLHGDAAFCGQGVVAETLSLNDLEGYKTGGTIHIVVNNQIGFTTNPENGHTSPYPTDVAMTIQAPIFHVNGDDPEAVAHAAHIAAKYRQRYQKDVVIDIFCYRKHGHNEGDEPMFTQPKMYHIIKQKQSPRDIYAQRLINEGVLTQEAYQTMLDEWDAFLEKEHTASQSYKPNKADMLEGKWTGLKHIRSGEKPVIDTGVPLNTLKKLGDILSEKPANITLNNKVARMLDAKAKMIASGEGLDWAAGEGLAFASLLEEGHKVRLSGQDVMRGTFSHRHSGMVDQENEAVYAPLNHVGKQAGYEFINSNLSEFAVLGFEYGYSVTDPTALTIWEAQFGDFANGAQIIIDQFIASAEAKWLRMSGLVMLLPHGYEGQGPEHSSARIERFLQLSADDNWQVVNCTTPANIFHALRRQLHRDFRKPLVVFTPKSLLRHKRAISSLDEMKTGTSFQRVIGEIASEQDIVADANIRKVLICSGKIYYDLLDAREAKGVKDVAIIRLEQFYPFPESDLRKELTRYTNAEVLWVQEEPENAGGWQFVDRRIEAVLLQAKGKSVRPRNVSRAASASPAVGYMKLHHKEQQAIMDEALA